MSTLRAADSCRMEATSVRTVPMAISGSGSSTETVPRLENASHGVSGVTTSVAEPVEASLEIETVVLVVVELVLA
jgi:hypothetical protein